LHLQKGELYDLESDIGESKNLAKEQPEQVAKLRALAEVMLRDLGDGSADAPGVRSLGRVANPQPMIHSDGHVRSGMDGVAKILP
jgi:arylsulfatase